jgi:predicted kinase
MPGLQSSKCQDHDEREAGVKHKCMTEPGRSPRLIIVCGLPGSGKTTLARTLENQLRAVRFAPDEWINDLSLDIYDEAKRAKIEELQWKLGQRLLALGLIVIIEWGTWGRSERDRLRAGARALGAAVELHYLSAPLEVLFNRIRCRGTESPPIERDALARWCEMFEAPTADEIALFDNPLISDAVITSP